MSPTMNAIDAPVGRPAALFCAMSIASITACGATTPRNTFRSW